MLQFSITGLYLIIFFKTAVAQDISDYASVVAESNLAPNVYCNNQNLTWDKAREACLYAKGTFMAYKTGLGMDVANLSFTSLTDIWTADYAWMPTVPGNSERLCGFRKIDHGILSSEVVYGDCEQTRYFLCKNDSTKGLNVYLGGRDSISCPDIYINSSELQTLPTGFYWTSSIVNVITDTWPSLGLPWHHPVMCGAYKKSVGKYFDDCVRKRVSLCRISMYSATGNYSNLFDKSCFVNWSIKSTPKTASKTPQSTHAVLNTMAQSTVPQRKTSLKIVPTPIVTTPPTTTTTGAMPYVTKSLHPETDASRDDGRSDTQSEKYSNVGVTVGLPVGLSIVVICGIILSVFFIRRNKRKLDQRSPEGDYDVISPNYASSNHIYSTLQRGDYGRFSGVKTDETACNVLSSP